jgi:hypothetical protein
MKRSGTVFGKGANRRSFLKNGIVAAGAATVGTGIFGGLPVFSREGGEDRDDRLTRGDIAILQLLSAIEQIEADLWQQYNELGGAVDAKDNPNPGNPAYVTALSNLDGDMPQYISDNTDDEISHARFLSNYLKSKGVQPVDLTPFKNLPSSQATGADKKAKRLTNLQSLNVDTSWYFRYRSTQNPDLGATFPQLLDITKQPAIPLNDTDTPPNLLVPIPPNLSGPNRMQAIANTAGLHFAFIEQGGSSLYPIMALKTTSLEALRIILSIGGVEIDHFSLWHDKGANAVSAPLAGITDPETGLTFPDFNNPNNQHNQGLSPQDQAAGSQMFQTNLILPEPCDFLNKDLGPVSIIRPTLTQNGGAVATIKSFTDDLLFAGQSPAFFQTVMELAEEADEAQREL